MYLTCTSDCKTGLLSFDDSILIYWLSLKVWASVCDELSITFFIFMPNVLDMFYAITLLVTSVSFITQH